MKLGHVHCVLLDKRPKTRRDFARAGDLPCVFDELAQVARVLLALAGGHRGHTNLASMSLALFKSTSTCSSSGGLEASLP